MVSFDDFIRECKKPVCGTDASQAPDPHVYAPFAQETPALLYHRLPIPGKFQTVPCKPMADQKDLALAYSPGVADACQAIASCPQAADFYTMKKTLVAVISNGTAVLGLGNIGALASKPVMEGKAVLFQKFSGLNAVDLEIDAQDPQQVVDIIASLAPSFGGINLEDFKAPECFIIEQALQERLSIPVFHDDQHGTAITVAAALTNALTLVGKTLETIKCVVLGAGASAIACLRLLNQLGLPQENIFVCDTKGLIHAERTDLTPHKAFFAQKTSFRTLQEAVQGADVLIGLSQPGAFTPDLIEKMNPKPIVLALSNPAPEIWPDDVYAVAPDALVGTGRSDIKNQVNNVLCFPYIFRGALDVGATHITLGMKKACVKALAGLAQQGFDDLTGAYNGQHWTFGPDFFLPKPFDPRLLVELPVAVAQAAMDEGIARTPVDSSTYRRQLMRQAFAGDPLWHAFLQYCHTTPPSAPTDIWLAVHPQETQEITPPSPAYAYSTAVKAARIMMQACPWVRLGFVGDRHLWEPFLRDAGLCLQKTLISLIDEIPSHAVMVTLHPHASVTTHTSCPWSGAIDAFAYTPNLQDSTWPLTGCWTPCKIDSSFDCQGLEIFTHTIREQQISIQWHPAMSSADVNTPQSIPPQPILPGTPDRVFRLFTPRQQRWHRLHLPVQREGFATTQAVLHHAAVSILMNHHASPVPWNDKSGPDTATQTTEPSLWHDASARLPGPASDQASSPIGCQYQATANVHPLYCIPLSAQNTSDNNVRKTVSFQEIANNTSLGAAPSSCSPTNAKDGSHDPIDQTASRLHRHTGGTLHTREQPHHFREDKTLFAWDKKFSYGGTPLETAIQQSKPTPPLWPAYKDA